ncbi:MAG: TIGR00296 family protein [Candidatus Micrarchaeaceae archaeon]
MKYYSIEDGIKIVKAARRAIEQYVSSTNFDREKIEKSIEKFKEHHGVFVTIEHYPTRNLRGCIGFPISNRPLKEALIDAAIAAATEDPRFVPVSHMEINDIVVEVSILSTPEKIEFKSHEELPKKVKVGRDGLIMRYGFYEGLLLPQVAVEEKWSAEEYLDNLSLKAGLMRKAWKKSGVELYRFSSQIFREFAPNEGIEEIILENL